MAPLPAAVQVPVPDGVQVHDVNVMPGGTASVKVAPATFAPPAALPTVTV